MKIFRWSDEIWPPKILEMKKPIIDSKTVNGILAVKRPTALPKALGTAKVKAFAQRSRYSRSRLYRLSEGGEGSYWAFVWVRYLMLILMINLIENSCPFP